jgi:hypothetical protein
MRQLSPDAAKRARDRAAAQWADPDMRKRMVEALKVARQKRAEREKQEKDETNEKGS